MSEIDSQKRKNLKKGLCFVVMYLYTYSGLRCTDNDSVEDEIIILKERLSSLANDVAALRSSVESGRRLTGKNRTGGRLL